MAEELNWQATRNENVAVTTASSQVCIPRNNANKRIVLLIRNISGNGTRITLSLSNFPAVANVGIVLEDGESLTDTSDISYECWQGPIQAIGSAAGTLTIFER